MSDLCEVLFFISWGIGLLLSFCLGTVDRKNKEIRELQSRITTLEKALEVSRKGLGTISLLLAEGKSLYTPEERRWIARNTEKQIEEILKQVREK